MPDENEARQWIVEPPVAPGEVSLYFACGEGADLTAEQEAALSALLRTLEGDDPEVLGHAKPCPSRGGCEEFSVCGMLSCGNVKCGALICGGLNFAPTDAGSTWNLMGSFRPGAI